MKKYSLLLVLLLGTIYIFAQSNNIEKDIFGDLQYSSNDRGYTAKLKKDIFDNLIFSDNLNNEITLEKKYLDTEFPGILQNERIKRRLMSNLIRENRNDRGYRAKYQIDIFGKLIIEDNRGYKLEKDKDIFGNDSFEENINGVKTSMKRNFFGGLDYSFGNEKASLKKDIFSKWVYEDSLGNKIEFGKQWWDTLIRRYRNDEGIFLHFIDHIFY